jgi:hypothetical protein
MGKINWGRVILGGLVAGVVIDVVEYVLNTMVLGSESQAAMKALGLPSPSSHAIAVFLVLGLVMGIAAIWLYAAARPRYGAGAKTAAITAVGFWVIGYAVPNAFQCVQGLFPSRLIVIGTLVGLVEIILASIAGAAVYKEA